MAIPEPFRLFVYLAGIMGFVGANAAYLVWVERKGAARFQRRPGPTEVGPAGLLQPIADAIKLLTKQVLVPPQSDHALFRLAPALVMAPALMCLAVIPFSAAIGARDLNLGLVMVFAFGSINVMAIMLGGWASRNKYAIISAARVVSQNVAYEIPMLLVVITLLMVTGTANLREIVEQQAGGFWKWNIFQLTANPLMPVTFLIYFICMLAETNRAPFDMAEAESELVAGAFTEYSGMGFGVFFMAEYANIVVGCSLGAILFFGGWQSPIGVFSGLFWFLIKLYLLIFTVIWIRWTFPRTQFYNLLNLSWKILIPVSTRDALAHQRHAQNPEAFSPMNVLREIITGFGSLLTGMRITLEQFFKREVTVRYPYDTLTMPKRYRGHIVLVRDPVTGKSLCVACKSCEKACPSDCIVVDGIKKEGDKKKSVTDFKLNFTTCSLCGSCVEVCPIEALQFSREYNLASTSKDAFYQIDLVKDVEKTDP